jgi:hypothetical protein
VPERKENDSSKTERIDRLRKCSPRLNLIDHRCWEGCQIRLLRSLARFLPPSLGAGKGPLTAVVGLAAKMFSTSKAGPARRLETFRIPADVLNKLLLSGFKSESDVRELQPSELAQEAGLSLQEAASVLRTVEGSQVDKHHQTALEMLDEEQNMPAVATFVRELDHMLGSGVALGKVPLRGNRCYVAGDGLCFDDT